MVRLFQGVYTGIEYQNWLKGNDFAAIALAQPFGSPLRLSNKCQAYILISNFNLL